MGSFLNWGWPFKASENILINRVLLSPMGVLSGGAGFRVRVVL